MFRAEFVSKETGLTHTLTYESRSEEGAIYAWEQDMLSRNLQGNAILISVWQINPYPPVLAIVQETEETTTVVHEENAEAVAA